MEEIARVETTISQLRESHWEKQRPLKVAQTRLANRLEKKRKIAECTTVVYGQLDLTRKSQLRSWRLVVILGAKRRLFAQAVHFRKTTYISAFPGRSLNLL